MSSPATHVTTVDGCAAATAIDSSTTAMEAATASTRAAPAATTTSATLGIELTGYRKRYQTGQKYLADKSHDVTLLMLEEEE